MQVQEKITSKADLGRYARKCGDGVYRTDLDHVEGSGRVGGPAIAVGTWVVAMQEGVVCLC